MSFRSWNSQMYTHLSAEALAQAITTMVTDQAMRQRAATVGEQIRAEDGEGNVLRKGSGNPSPWCIT